ncbi:MAG TPA: serine acetyltransferase [Candidatus Brocadiia bacterium]|nr:serine acetyltransferase [Candidatus Brocadiia bacterium]
MSDQEKKCPKHNPDAVGECPPGCEDESYPSLKHRRQLPQVVREIVGKMGNGDGAGFVNAYPMPSEDAVITILDLLMSILFPGYRGSQDIDPTNLEYHVGQNASRVFDLLSAQIARSYRHECKRLRNDVCTHCMDRGQREAIEFMKKVPALMDMLGLDLQAAYDGDPAAKSRDEIIFSYPGLRAIVVYRLAHELHAQGVPLLPRIMTEYAHRVTGIDIHPGATAGRSFFIDHGTGVVIGETTTIGNNVRLYQGVTLGALSIPRMVEGNMDRQAKRHPTIEDDVIIYSNATILGGETVIGKGSIIGGNVFVTKSIPPGSRVILPSASQSLLQEPKKT